MHHPFIATLVSSATLVHGPACGSISRLQPLPPPWSVSHSLQHFLKGYCSPWSFCGTFSRVLLLCCSLRFNLSLPINNCPPPSNHMMLHTCASILPPPPMMHLFLGKTRLRLLYVPPCGWFSGAFVLKCRLYCYVSRHGLKSNFSHFCGSISRASILHPPPPMMRLPFIATIVSRVVVVLGPSVGHFPGLFYSVLLLAVQSVAFNQLLPPPQPPCCAIHVSPFCLRPPPMMHLLGETRPGLLYVPPCGSFSGAFVLPPFPPPLHNASPLHCNTCL